MARFPGQDMAELRRSTRAHAHLAAFRRILRFESVDASWRAFHDHDPVKTAPLLSGAEDVLVLADEPDYWHLPRALANMYAAVAETHLPVAGEGSTDLCPGAREPPTWTR